MGSWTTLNLIKDNLEEEYHAKLLVAAPHDFSCYCEYMVPEEPPSAKLHRFFCDILMKVESREIMKLICSVPPAHAKTTYFSRLYPTWYMGRNPTHKYIQAGHTTSFCESQFGKINRNTIDSNRYRNVFPTIQLSKDSKAAGSWGLSNGKGAYLTRGIGQGISGYRANMAAVDDPFASREDAESETIRQKVYDWFMDDLTTRLLPNSPICVVACITGEIPIYMSDGTWKRMDEVTAGDKVLAYHEGNKVVRTVTHTINQGPDDILKVSTGNSTVRCNSKHPFLVYKDGVMKWVEAGNLQKNDKLVVSNKDNPSKVKATLTVEESYSLGFMMGDGWVTINNKLNKDKQGNKTYKTKSYVTCLADCPAHPHRVERVLAYYSERFSAKFKLTKAGYYRNEKADLGRYLLQFCLNAGAHYKRVPLCVFKQPDYIKRAFLDGFMGADGWGITDGQYNVKATQLCNYLLVQDLRRLARGLGKKVTNVYKKTWMAQPPNSPEPFEATSYTFRTHNEEIKERFVLSNITSIACDGHENVYDLTVDGENFIADGVVVHNTRWHEDDLCGRLEQMSLDGKGEPWQVINFPAFAEEDDPLGRPEGEALWPEFYTKEFLNNIKATMSPRGWNSLYCGRPVDIGGGVLRADWISRYDKTPNIHKDKAKIRKITISVDSAIKATDRHDWTVLTVWIQMDDSKHYLVDVIRRRVEFNDLVKLIDSVAKYWMAHRILVEDKGSGTQYIQVRGANSSTPSPIPVIPISTNNLSKEFRFDAVTPMYESGIVLLPKVASWLAAYERELLSFPTAKYDDQVDSSSQYLEYVRGTAKLGTKKLRISW